MREMTVQEVREVLGSTKQASDPGKVEDGTRIHVRYERIPGGRSSEKAKEEAKRAEDLGLPKDSYTGRVSRIFLSKKGDIILNMFVELERDHTYRSFNIDKGKIKNVVVLGE